MGIRGKYIRFDWAAKRLLRNKANFGVLEGFLTVLTGEEIRIIEIQESESNPISILYFDLGIGSDYLYYGQSFFIIS